MPADSFESPLTLAACGGHVELAALLIERGANLEEVNDEGYTPLMEAAREGHEEMVALLLAQGIRLVFTLKPSVRFCVLDFQYYLDMRYIFLESNAWLYSTLPVFVHCAK